MEYSVHVDAVRSIKPKLDLRRSTPTNTAVVSFRRHSAVVARPVTSAQREALMTEETDSIYSSAGTLTNSLYLPYP